MGAYSDWAVNWSFTVHYFGLGSCSTKKLYKLDEIHAVWWWL